MGLDTTRARNRYSLVAAHRAGLKGERKDAGISWKSKVPALHREAERDTTGSNSRQPSLHTLNGPAVQGKRRRAATVTVIHRAAFKLQLTLRFYCGKRVAGGPVFNIRTPASVCRCEGENQRIACKYKFLVEFWI